MNKKDLIYIYHINDSIKKILEYCEGISEEDFIKKSLVQDAVIRKIEIIGEASSKLSKEFKSENNFIPWKNIVGMRNKLIHDYFGVDVIAVWQTVNTDIPELKGQIEIIINKSDQPLSF